MNTLMILIGVAVATSGPGSATAAQPVRVEREIPLRGDLAHANELSGVARWGDFLIVCSDEGSELNVVRSSDHRLAAKVGLLKDEDDEIDMEEQMAIYRREHPDLFPQENTLPDALPADTALESGADAASESARMVSASDSALIPEPAPVEAPPPAAPEAPPPPVRTHVPAQGVGLVRNGLQVGQGDQAQSRRPAGERRAEDGVRRIPGIQARHQEGSRHAKGGYQGGAGGEAHHGGGQQARPAQGRRAGRPQEGQTAQSVSLFATLRALF